MSEERTKRREEIIWEKAKEIWKDWKVTISILWFLFVFITAFGAWGIFYWLSRNFSGEIDAAMINSLVSIFVTVPITLLTGAGTILVTVYFNLQTQKIAVQSQRSTLRDKILEKRLEIYPKLRWLAADIDSSIRNQIDLDKLKQAIPNLSKYALEHERFISQKMYSLLKEIHKNALIFSLLPEDQHEEKNDTKKKISQLYTEIWTQMEKELDFQILDLDWKELQTSYNEEADQ